MVPKKLLPIVVLVIAIAGALALLATRKTVTPQPLERRLTSVRVRPVMPESVQLYVHSQGTVMPRTESQLIPEVSGPVVWTAPALVSGGYFEKGDPLVRIDPARYETALERAHANLGRTTGEYEYAEAMLRRQKKLAADQIVSANNFEEAQRAMSVAEASRRDARAALEEAERDLARTEIRAPFRGRVREETVDVGQFLNRGTAFATLYATDYLEVRLPVSDDQLAYFDEPIWEQGLPTSILPPVRLHTTFAGAERSWWGRVVRTEGEIDPKSRMVHVVARIDNTDDSGVRPSGHSGTTPLPVGLFVQAEIEASQVDNIYVLPRSALWDEGHVVVADDDDRLRRRQVEVLRIDRTSALISGGLEPGDRVSVSPPGDLIEGQLVTPLEDATVEVDS